MDSNYMMRQSKVLSGKCNHQWAYDAVLGGVDRVCLYCLAKQQSRMGSAWADVPCRKTGTVSTSFDASVTAAERRAALVDYLENCVAQAKKEGCA